jgi:hypothetical protein
MDTPTPRPPQAQLIGYLQLARQNMPIIATQEAFIGDRTRQTCTPTDAIAALNEALHDLPIAISFEIIAPPTYKRCVEQKKVYKSNDKIDVTVYRATVQIRFTITDGESDMCFDVVGQSNDYEGEASALKKAIMGAYKTFIELAFMARKGRGKSTTQNAHNNQQPPYSKTSEQGKDTKERTSPPPPNTITTQQPKAAAGGNSQKLQLHTIVPKKDAKNGLITLDVIANHLDNDFYDVEMLRGVFEEYRYDERVLLLANAAMNIKLGKSPFNPKKEGDVLGDKLFEAVLKDLLSGNANGEVVMGIIKSISGKNLSTQQHIELVAGLLKFKQLSASVKA